MIGERLSHFCNFCRRPTQYESVYGYNTSVETRFPDESVGVTYLLSEAFRCDGCQILTLRVCGASTNTDIAFEVWYPSEIVRYFPPWWDSLSGELAELGREVYSSLNHGNVRLAAMGIRALIERIARAKGQAKGSFKQLLDGLIEAKILNAVGRQCLETVLEFGHAAVHRAYAPSQQDVSSALAILENVIEHSYVLPAVAVDLSGRVPQWVK